MLRSGPSQRAPGAVVSIGLSGNFRATGGPTTLDASTTWRWETAHPEIRPTPF